MCLWTCEHRSQVPCRRLSCLPISPWSNPGRMGVEGVESPFGHAGTGPRWSWETGNTQRYHREEGELSGRSLSPPGLEISSLLGPGRWGCSRSWGRAGPGGSAGQSGRGGCHLRTLRDFVLQSWNDRKQECLASRWLWRSCSQWKTKLELFVLLLSCLAALLHGGKSRAEDFLLNNQYFQDVIALSVREVGEIQPRSCSTMVPTTFPEAWTAQRHRSMIIRTSSRTAGLCVRA